MSTYSAFPLRLYKWTVTIFLMVYIVYIIFDDYALIGNISSYPDLGWFLLFQFLLLMEFAIAFSIFYWMIALLIIFGYRQFKR